MLTRRNILKSIGATLFLPFAALADSVEDYSDDRYWVGKSPAEINQGMVGRVNSKSFFHRPPRTVKYLGFRFRRWGNGKLYGSYHFEIIPTGYSTISEKYKWEEYPKEIPDIDFNKITFDVTGDVEKHVVWHAQGIPDTW